MPDEPDYTLILAAKVTMLERLVRTLFKDAFLKADDPLAAVDSFAKRYVDRLEKAMARPGEVDVPWIVMSENLNSFFDQLRRDVALTKSGQEGPQS